VKTAVSEALLEVRSWEEEREEEEVGEGGKEGRVVVVVLEAGEELLVKIVSSPKGGTKMGAGLEPVLRFSHSLSLSLSLPPSSSLLLLLVLVLVLVLLALVIAPSSLDPPPLYELALPLLPPFDHEEA